MNATTRIKPIRAHFVSSFAVGLASLSGAMGCLDVQVVGQAASGGSVQSSGGSSSQVSGSGGTSEGGVAEVCSPPSDFMREALATYDAWSQAPNDLGDLAGTTWKGFILGGQDLTLTVLADGSANLQVGEPPESMDKDKGYLCGGSIECTAPSNGNWIRAGGNYPLHDATFADGRLKVDLDPGSAYDAWCRAQTPILDPQDCSYAMVEPGTITRGPTRCSVAGKVVDCDWFNLAVWEGTTCVCTAETCFPQSFPVDLDSDLDAESSKFTGIIGDEDFVLTKVMPTDCAIGAAGAAGSCNN